MLPCCKEEMLGIFLSSIFQIHFLPLDLLNYLEGDPSDFANYRHWGVVGNWLIGSPNTPENSQEWQKDFSKVDFQIFQVINVLSRP